MNGPGPRLGRILVPAGLFAVSCAASAWSYRRHFEGGITHEFCHYAEIGRNLIEGRGLRTGMVYPFTLAALERRGIPFDDASLAPVLDRFPLQAWLVAAAEAVLGANDAAPALVSVIALALCAGAAFWAGCAFFTPAEGAIAGLLVALNPSFQRGFVLWGLPDFPFCLLAMGAVAAVCRDRWLAGGLLAGAAWLARSNLVLWLPLFAWAAWRDPAGKAPGRAARLALFFGAALAVSAPGWAYNLRWYGSVNPPTLDWNLAHHAVQDAYPLLSYREFPPLDTLLHHLPALARKFRHHLWLHLTDFPTLWQGHLLFPLAVLGAAVTLKPQWASRGPGDADPSPEAGRFTGLTLAMLALQVLAFSFLRYETLGPWVRGRYFLWFAPAYFLMAARGASSLSRRAGIERLGPAAFCAANVAFFAWWLAAPQGPPAHPRRLSARDWPEVAAAAFAAEPGSLVATNLPAQIAWYARRRAVALPADPEELLAMGRRHRIGAVLVSRLAAGEIGQLPRWQALLEEPAALEAFCRTGGFRVGEDFGTALLLVRAGP